MTISQPQNPPQNPLSQSKLSPSLPLRRIGIIDIGSNSVRLVIYEMLGASATPVYNEKVLAGLGRSLKTDGKLYAEGRAQTFKALTRFKALSDAHKLDDMKVIATAAMREASDGQDFVRRVKAEIGFNIEILSGEQEAQMAAHGVISAQPLANGIVADLGGASLELVDVKDKTLGTGQSFPLGPFVMIENENGRLADHYDPGALRAKLQTALDGISERFSAKDRTLYLVGGAWRNLASIHNERTGYPLKILHSYSMSRGAALELAQWAAEDAANDLMSWPGLSTRRAETLPYAGLMLEALISKLSPRHIVISPSGVREGCLYASLPDTLKARDSLFDVCRHLATGNLQAEAFSQPLYDWLQPAAQSFPRCFEEPKEDRLRFAACLLAGLGKGLHPDHREDLVFNEVLYAPLSGLTHKERAYLALMLYSSYTAKSITPNQSAIDYHLMEREKKAAQIYGAAMRLATVISASSANILSALSLQTHDNVLSLTVDAKHYALLNRRGALRLKRLGELADMQVQSNWMKSTAPNS